MHYPSIALAALTVAVQFSDPRTLGPHQPNGEIMVSRAVIKDYRLSEISRDGWASRAISVDERIVWDSFDAPKKTKSIKGCHITAFTFRDTHELAFVGDREGNIYQWAALQSETEFVVKKGGQKTNTVARLYPPSAAGLLAASCYGGSRLCFFDLKTRKEVFSIDKQANVLAFSPNGRIAIFATDHELSALDTTKFRPIWHSRAMKKDGLIVSISFSPNGSHAVVCNSNLNEARIDFIDAKNGALMDRNIVYKYERDPVGSEQRIPPFPAAQFSPRGLFLASSFDSPTVDVWEIATARRAFQVKGYHNCTRIRFSAPNHLITVGGDKEVYLWDLTRTPGFRKFRVANSKIKESAWTALKSLDPMEGAAATEYYCDNPKEFFAFASGGSLIPAPPSNERIEEFIKALDASTYAVREKAVRDLVAIGEAVHPALESALQKKLSREVRRRLKDASSRIPMVDGLGEDAHRQLRAVFILERIATTESCTILKKIEQEAMHPAVRAAARTASASLASNQK